MKKILCILIASLVLCAMPVTIFADSTGGSTMISTYISPSYTVMIPADISVAFNATDTDFGNILITSAQIDPDKCIKVTLISDGKLENRVDRTKVIPYTIKSGDNIFTYATYLDEGESTSLKICITKEDWNRAYAGEYRDTVTFVVTYVAK